MQKTIVYLLLLAILGGGVYYFVFSEKESVFGAKEAAFTVRDTAGIGKVFLAKTNGSSITITRTDSGWMLNDAYKARMGTVNSLLRTLHMQEAQFPVPENSHNAVIKSLAASGVKVEVFNRAGKKINTFYVGGGTSGNQGTYMLQEHARRPYIVQIPNFNGYLTPVFSTDFDEWRDRTVINLRPEEVKTFSMQYVEAPKNSFTIQQTDKVNITADPEVMGNKPLNKRRANAYLRFFSDIYCEGYLNGMPQLDSVIRSVPKFCVMDVTSKSGWQQHIEIFYLPLNRRSKNLATAHEGDYDIDRFYGVINNFRDTVLLQSFTFDKFFRSAYEFFEPEKPVEIMGVPNNAK